MIRRSWLATASVAIFTLVSTSIFAQQGQMPSAAPACGSGHPIIVDLLYPTQPVSLDGNYDTIILFSQITRNVFDGLFKLDDEMKVQPNLATGYEKPDDKTYDITLRDGVVFQDGSPFTATDVIYSFDRIANDQKLASKQRTYVTNVESVTRLSDNKVRFKLKQPDASFVGVLASMIYITPKAVIDKVGNVEFGKNPVGTGPFKFERWNQGDGVVLKANCSYWGDKPIPREVEFRFISEPATQISSLLSGEIDIATEVTPDLAAGLKSSPNVSVKSVTGNNTFSLTLNTLEGPFTDKRVRQALNYAVNKEAITKTLLNGHATPVGQPYGPSILGYTKSVAPYPFDPERAKKLLNEAGYNNSKPLAIELFNSNAEANPVWQSIASYFTDVGINVKTRFDPNFFADVWLQKKMKLDQIWILTNTNILMDADFALGLAYHGARRGLYFHTPETDALIAEARGQSDPLKRQSTYEMLNADLYDRAPVVFLYTKDGIYGVNNSINWKPRPDGAIYLAGIKKTK